MVVPAMTQLLLPAEDFLEPVEEVPEQTLFRVWNNQRFSMTIVNSLGDLMEIVFSRKQEHGNEATVQPLHTADQWQPQH